MFTDIVGYTAMMQVTEQKAVLVIKHYNAALERWVKHFNGQVLNFYGDGSLCIFPSALVEHVPKPGCEDLNKVHFRPACSLCLELLP